jgi:hypothetical protein
MQHGLVHVKYAFKCAAWCHIVTLKHTKEDVSFVQCYFKYEAGRRIARMS